MKIRTTKYLGLMIILPITLFSSVMWGAGSSPADPSTKRTPPPMFTPPTEGLSEGSTRFERALSPEEEWKNQFPECRYLPIQDVCVSYKFSVCGKSEIETRWAVEGMNCDDSMLGDVTSAIPVQGMDVAPTEWVIQRRGDTLRETCEAPSSACKGQESTCKDQGSTCKDRVEICQNDAFKNGLRCPYKPPIKCRVPASFYGVVYQLQREVDMPRQLSLITYDYFPGNPEGISRVLSAFQTLKGGDVIQTPHPDLIQCINGVRAENILWPAAR